MPTIDQLAQQKFLDDQKIIKQMSKNVIEDVASLNNNVVNLSTLVDTNNTKTMNEIIYIKTKLAGLELKIDNILSLLSYLK
jgi:hypothetical protein